jgi:diguanylate cyclase (GGDEF)-like protein
MPVSNRLILLAFLSLSCVELLLFSSFGVAKPVEHWKLLDMAGEGGTALMAACWMVIVLGSRPAGRVTLLLTLGLAAVALGAWADCLDEFFAVTSPLRFDKWLESVLTPLGMLLVTAGIVAWRTEQLQLSEHMQRRERLFREHRAFDRITQLADAHYLRQQMAIECAADRSGSLVLLELAGFQNLQRTHGKREADRMLQAVTHQLLLNLRNQDLLCRYAGERLAVLLPGTPLVAAERAARHLQQMVGLTHFHTGDGEARATLTLLSACAELDDDADAVLARLNRELEGEALRTTAALAA